MKLVFNKIRYQNLMSVGQKPVEIQLDSVKKTLITGKNGGGKSTMLEALCFALFGTPFRKIKKGQLVNSQNKKKCLVELWFTLGKDSFYIKRGIKPNLFTVEKNGEEWDESSTLMDFQTKLEEQLKISPVAFKQIVVLGTAGYVPFMELSTPNRRKLVEELLEVSVLGVMSDLNKSELKGLTQEMTLIENQIESLRREIDAYQTYIDKQKELESSHVGDLQSELNSHLTEIKSLKSSLDVLENEASEVRRKYDDSLDELIRQYANATSKLNDALTNKSNMLESFKSGKCPTCNQDFVNHDKVNEVSCEIEEFNRKLEKISTLSSTIEKRKIVSDSAKSKLDELNSGIKEIKSKLVVHIQSAKNLKNKLDEMKIEPVDDSKISELQSKMVSLKSEKTSIFDKKYTRTLVADMLKDSGIKASVVKRYIPVFNKKINHYLKIMGADYTFTIDEEFNEVIRSRGREDFSYESFSQGERARIDLSLLFTWRDISVLVSGLEINLLILDEVGDGAADAEGVKSIMKIIDSMKESNAFIISHREEHDKENYGKWIEMSKKGRFSIMEIKHVQESA